MNKRMIGLLQSLELKLLLPFILATALLACFVLLKRVRKPYPPGPKGWPLLGCITMMNLLTHRGLAKLAKQYGEILHLRIGFLHIISVSSPGMAQQVLQVQDHVFSNRPANTAITYLTYSRSDFVFAHYGPFWRQMRKLCVTKLFKPKRVESWDSVRIEVDEMIRAIASRAGTAVNIGEFLFGLTRSIIYRAAFGSTSREGQDEFLKIVLEFSKLFVAFNIADFIPGLRWMDTQGLNGRMRKARASLDRFIDTIIEDHEVKRKVDSSKNDMVDELLSFCCSDEKVSELGDDLQESLKLTRNNIKGIIMDVMFGGTETVASSLEWVMAELLTKPEYLNKVQQELANTVGLGRQVQESDLKNLTYLNCCIKETLRLHPPIPLLLHETAVDTTVNGYHIPKKSHVMINVWAIGRDNSVWEEPEEFKPQRFLKDGAPDFKGMHFQFITFGSGRRSCPGMQLGLYALEMAVARLLHCFTWELPNGMKPSEIDMDEMLGLTATRAHRLVAVPNPRLIC